MTVSIGFSQFARERHVLGTGHSFFTITEQEVLDRVRSQWGHRGPGTGETDLERKVLVPIDPTGFYTSSVTLQDGLPLRAEIVRRQAHEDPYVEVYLDADEAKRLGIKPIAAKECNIVCYSKEALLENNGTRSTNCEWEIVCVLASLGGLEPMPPLTMARNFLQKEGGTLSYYTAEQFAEAIYAHSQRGIKIKSVTPDYSGLTAAQISAKVAQIKTNIKALNRQLGDLERNLEAISRKCKHEFEPVGQNDSAVCLHCRKHFGWRCPDSPDGVCHTQCEVDDHGQLELVDGTEVFVHGVDLEDQEATCVYCGEYDERK